MNSDTWTDRDLPVLSAAVEIYDQTGELAQTSDLMRACGFDAATVQRALRSLATGPYFVETDMDNSGTVCIAGPPTADALRVVGQWPSAQTQLERLIAALQAAADDPARPDEDRSRFRQAAAWLGTTASAIAIGALGGAGGNILTG